MCHIFTYSITVVNFSNVCYTALLDLFFPDFYDDENGPKLDLTNIVENHFSEGEMMMCQHGCKATAGKVVQILFLVLLRSAY